MRWHGLGSKAQRGAASLEGHLVPDGIFKAFLLLSRFFSNTHQKLNRRHSTFKRRRAVPTTRRLDLRLSHWPPSSLEAACPLRSAKALT